MTKTSVPGGLSVWSLSVTQETMKTKHLHWFWRGLIAVLLGVGLFSVLATVGTRVTGHAPGPAEYIERLLDMILGRLRPGIADRVIAIGIAYAGPSLALCLLAYVWLGGRSNYDDEPGETLCRQCGYILRGISEPRCPECGEVI